MNPLDVRLGAPRTRVMYLLVISEWLLPWFVAKHFSRSQHGPAWWAVLGGACFLMMIHELVLSSRLTVSEGTLTVRVFGPLLKKRHIPLIAIMRVIASATGEPKLRIELEQGEMLVLGPWSSFTSTKKRRAKIQAIAEELTQLAEDERRKNLRLPDSDSKAAHPNSNKPNL
jgi:hypothetical protein